MQVASLELCKELYELSGWDDTHYIHSDDDIKSVAVLNYNAKYQYGELWDDVEEAGSVPAYDLGYLLRKLPGGVAIKKNPQRSEGRDYICFQIDTDYRENQYADTPEDAACKLAIELAKQGLLPTQPKRNGE